MKIRTMHWGYDGGGVACGPVEGNTIIEICVTADDNHNYFVMAMRMSEFMKIIVSSMPLFDVIIHMNHYDVEFETEWEKVTSNVLESFDYEIGDAPEEEMAHSRFSKVLHLIRVAMQGYYGDDDEETDAQTAMEFIKPYVGEDLEEMELPELDEKDPYDEDEEDFDEDEEEE